MASNYMLGRYGEKKVKRAAAEEEKSKSRARKEGRRKNENKLDGITNNITSQCSNGAALNCKFGGENTVVTS